MTKEYIEKLIKLAEELQDYNQTTDIKDLTFLEKINYLIGYILALKEQNDN